MRGGDKEGQNKMQLIDERGEFDEHACESFLHDAANAHEWNKKYTLMSIMGPQSSGKSTLMNHAFGTSFREMDGTSKWCATRCGSSMRNVWVHASVTCVG